MNFTNSEIINCNGQRYKVGWDEHGWFSIYAMEEDPESGDWIVAEEQHAPNISPMEIDVVQRLIEEGP
jgi:hypothetical protein